MFSKMYRNSKNELILGHLRLDQVLSMLPSQQEADERAAFNDRLSKRQQRVQELRLKHNLIK